VHVVHQTFKVLQFIALCHCHWQSVIQMVTPYDARLAFVPKITFVLRKINKN